MDKTETTYTREETVKAMFIGFCLGCGITGLPFIIILHERGLL